MPVLGRGEGPLKGDDPSDRRGIRWVGVEGEDSRLPGPVARRLPALHCTGPSCSALDLFFACAIAQPWIRLGLKQDFVLDVSFEESRPSSAHLVAPIKSIARAELSTAVLGTCPSTVDHHAVAILLTPALVEG